MHRGHEEPGSTIHKLRTGHRIARVCSNSSTFRASTGHRRARTWADRAAHVIIVVKIVTHTCGKAAYAMSVSDIEQKMGRGRQTPCQYRTAHSARRQIDSRAERTATNVLSRHLVAAMPISV
eukprot:571655-Rhodomonas_salina.2